MSNSTHGNPVPSTPSGHHGPQRSVDVLVIGAGPAGLQAALTAGRVHRTVLLLDHGQPRNAPASHMHNVVTHDGTPPADFRAAARDQFAAYPWVEVADLEVLELDVDESGATAVLADGSTAHARAVVLATGMRDVLPDVEGLEPLFGRLAHHCPFCHGHELADQRVGIVAGERSGHLGLLLGPIAGEVVVLTEPVEMREQPPGRVTVRLADGATEVVDGVFVATELVQRSALAERLGLDLNPSGAVRIDAFGRTSVAGIFAAGDMAHHPDLPMPAGSVIAAAGAGATAGGAAVAHLLMNP